MKLKVLFLSTLFSFGLFFSLVVPVQAQGTFKASAINEVNEVNTAIDRADEYSNEINIYSVTEAVDTGTEVLLLNKMVGKPGEPGALVNVGQAIGAIFAHTPASGERYVADLLYNMKIGPAQPAYAQVGGLGFAALEPILYAWKQFRNIAYLFFIIITLIIGFMIMMRQKIGGQAAVTAQQAIPQIVIALITVTFSYAIAGFAIDLMYVFMYLFAGLFPDQSGGTAVISQGLFAIGLDMFTGIGTTAFSAVSGFVTNQLGGGAVESLIGGISGLTFAVIIAIAYLFAMIQLFFELLKTYIAIIVSIVLSPLLLMMGALPGRNDIFAGWVRGLAGNLVAFPVVLLLIILHKLMTENGATDGGFLPPFLGGRGNGGAITSLIGLSIMLISKDLVSQAKKSVNPKGSGIFEQFGPALSSAVSKGWKGDNLIPGVGFTNTAKIPFVGSGKQVAQTAATGIGGLTGGVLGGGFDYLNERRKTKGSPMAGTSRTKKRTYFLNSMEDSARRTGSFVGGRFKKNEKESK